MIEFSGRLTGEAEKFFVRKSRKIGLVFIVCGIVFALPVVLFVGKVMFRDDKFIYIMLCGLGIIPLIAVLPKGKKEHLAMLPKRIYTNRSQIICVADRYTDTKQIQDVKKVIDHGEFYELCFPFGKVSEKFVCQKSLLSKGSLGAFERLFEGKMIKRM